MPHERGAAVTDTAQFPHAAWPPAKSPGPALGAGDSRSPSAWAPLRVAFFRWVWLAGLVSNIGTFMHNVGAAWLMTSLTHSPGQVALQQTAAVQRRRTRASS